MKIGILAYRQAPYISANTAIAYIIGDQLSQNNEVVYIGRKQDHFQDGVSSYNGNKIIHLNRTLVDGNSRINNYLIRIGLVSIAYYKDSASLAAIVNKESIDVLICVIAPSDDLYITMSSKLNIPIYLYQLDPFYNLKDTENKRLKREFIKYLKRTNHLFTTELLMKEYIKDPFIKPYIEKISVVQFPKLIEHKTVEKAADLETMLLYTGSLYAGRKPDYLLQLKKILPANCNIVFCGKCENSNDDRLLKDSGIICKGYCTQEVLMNEIDDSDILINIGNTVKNQLPSKVIDYISTGKPIINFTQIHDCSSKKALEDYELCLNIDVNSISENSGVIKEFITKVKGKTIPWNRIKEQYCEYLPEYVAGTILEQIKYDLADD